MAPWSIGIYWVDGLSVQLLLDVSHITLAMCRSVELLLDLSTLGQLTFGVTPCT